MEVSCNHSTLSSRRSVSYRNQYIDLHSNSMAWFVYHRDLCHGGVKLPLFLIFVTIITFNPFYPMHLRKFPLKCIVCVYFYEMKCWNQLSLAFWEMLIFHADLFFCSLGEHKTQFERISKDLLIGGNDAYIGLEVSCHETLF